MLIESQYFPSIQFWAKALDERKLCIEAHENYQKRSYRNKCEILTVNKPLTLSVPLISGKNAGMAIKDVKISNVENWNTQHLQTIRSAYGNAPYFEFYWDAIEQIVNTKFNYLYDLNWQILCFFTKMYGISLTESEAYERDFTGLDLRQKILPKNAKPDYLKYDQVFSDRHAFVPNLSILDLLFCQGPESKLYMIQLNKKEQEKI